MDKSKNEIIAREVPTKEEDTQKPFRLNQTLGGAEGFEQKTFANKNKAGSRIADCNAENGIVV